MSLSTAEKNLYVGGLVAGAVGVIGFGILASNSDGGSQKGYIIAAVALGIVAMICFIVLKKNKG